MKSTIRIILASAAITAAALKAVPALAEPAAVQTIVQTADLDLSTSAGRQQLDRRLAQAAWEVCGASDADLQAKNDARECRAQVLDQAHIQREQLLTGTDRGSTIAFIAAR